MDAAAHWSALDRLFGRILTGVPATEARQRLGRRAAALSEIYLRRLMKTAPHDRHCDCSRQLHDLQQTHRALTAALGTSFDADETTRS
jgi:hypothetical protein